MPKLETVVRPFQEGDVFNARVLVPKELPQAPAEDVVVSWGQPIDLIRKALGIRDLRGGSGKLSEVSRVTTTVRVENPTDPAQFVDIERIEKLNLRDDETGSEQTWTLNNG